MCFCKNRSDSRSKERLYWIKLFFMKEPIHMQTFFVRFHWINWWKLIKYWKESYEFRYHCVHRLFQIRLCFFARNFFYNVKKLVCPVRIILSVVYYYRQWKLIAFFNYSYLILVLNALYNFLQHLKLFEE